MASTLTKALIHITFSTKHREPLITEELESDLHTYLGGICRRMESPAITIGGTADHVHMLVSLSKTVALSDLMLNVKRDSSRFAREKGAPTFSWQEGYFAFSIGESAADDLIAYIAKQKEHHKRIDFKDEMRAILRKYGVEFDERYVWA